MAVFLSLLTAAMFGTGDFLGGMAAKRASILQVVAGSHLVGLIGVLAVTPLVADAFSWTDLGLGAAGGAFGGAGVALLYRGLARGPMAVVAPLTAVTSAAVPAVWGLADGDELSAAAWIGVGLALVAIGLVSVSTDSFTAPVTPLVVVEALLAGTGFGLFFIFLDITDGATAPWPVVGARLVTSVTLIGVILLTRRQLVPADRLGAGLIVATGAFDTGSNVAFLFATDQGQLTLVAVLSSLYPIVTVLLARVVLSERMTRLQLAGFVAALSGTVLIAAG